MCVCKMSACSLSHMNRARVNWKCDLIIISDYITIEVGIEIVFN